ncbi:MAG: imidazolonepropionase [Myxococcota bacterium]
MDPGLGPDGAAGDDPLWTTAARALGVIRDAAVVADAAGRVRWVGARADAPADPDAEVVDLGGAVVLPGLVDPHTHLVYAGDRTADFAARCAGLSYEEVARRGGGIRLTVRATRAASVEDLVALARPRLRDLLAHGVTAVEIKSGYGLTLADEVKMLEVARRLGEEGPVRVIPTLLAAHIVPDEFRHDRAAYVRLITDEILPEVHRRRLARHVDVFCDAGAYTVEETVTILDRARSLGFGLKVHAEQLGHTGGSAAAAGLGAVSADHLEHVSEADVEAMAEAGTVAVLLPGASAFLGTARRAPGRRLVDGGVDVALATDCNPGTCPSRHLPLMITLGCTLQGLRPEEALIGVTRSAARAIGLEDGTGTVTPGAPCDLAVCDVPGFWHIPYQMAANPVREVWIAGERVHVGNC